MNPAQPEPSAATTERRSRGTTTSELRTMIETLQATIIDLERKQATQDVALQAAQAAAELATQRAIMATPTQPPRANEGPRTCRVPNGMPTYAGKRGEDARQWTATIATACRINGHAVTEDNRIIPQIASTVMTGAAAGWYLKWSTTIPEEEQTWGNFCTSALNKFEASNYQANLRQSLRKLKQTGEIEDYNGKFSEMIFRVEDMGELDQISNYITGLKPKVRAYLKLENPATLEEAMDLATKYEIAHFDEDDHNLRKVTMSRQDKPSFTNGNKKPFFNNDNKKFRPKGQFKPTFEKKPDDGKKQVVCHHCKKPGHFKRDCYFLKNKEKEQGNEAPRQ